MCRIEIQIVSRKIGAPQEVDLNEMISPCLSQYKLQCSRPFRQAVFSVNDIHYLVDERKILLSAAIRPREPQIGDGSFSGVIFVI